MDTKAKARVGKKGRVGEVRCVNCFARFRPSPGAEQATCPNCKIDWYISWKGDLAKIRKPVWENWEQNLAKVQETEE
jgi:hypothetical protein